MNVHLDRFHDRVGSYYATGYLKVPSLLLDPGYQIEISAAELSDPNRFLSAGHHPSFRRIE